MEKGKERASTRRMRGRYSGRLSRAGKRGSDEAFRVDPEFFRFVIESLEDYAIVTTNKELAITSWNLGAKTLLGYEESEIIGEHVERLFVPEDREEGVVDWEFREAEKKGRVKDERWHLRKDGSRFWTYGVAFPLKDERGAIRGFVKAMRDESERKRAAEDIEEKEERLRLAAEATGFGTWDYRPDRGELHGSERCLELLGLPSGMTLTYDAFLERLHPEDRGRVREALRACLGGPGSPRCRVECRVPRPGSAPRWVRLEAKSFSIPVEEKARLIGTIVDVTETRLARERSERLSAELERGVQERTESLSMANREIETFAYSASHDLRAPLRKIALFSQLIQERHAGRLDPEGRGCFARIQAASRNMQKLIEDLLNLTRVTRHEIVPGEVDLSEEARAIARDLQAGQPGRKTSFVIEPGVRARGDRDLLAIALRNLLENAWKFTGKREEARIEFGREPIPGGEAYYVRDNGVGFDMAHAGKMFGDFQRLHQAEDFPGTGVGLGIVARVVRRHRGRVWAEGRPGAGATLRFTLYTEGDA